MSPVSSEFHGEKRYSSRGNIADAGWRDAAAVAPETIPPAAGQSRRFSWSSPRPLWQCRNQVIGALFGDPTGKHRRRWLDLLGLDPDDDFHVDGYADRRPARFVVMGDSGEGDEAQYRVVPTLVEQAKETDFLFICSDVVYPAGGIEAYGPTVLGPYRRFPGAIYGIPGNHCWFDDADGFMYWFCGATERPRRRRAGRWRLRELLWRRSPPGRTAVLKQIAGVRPQPDGSDYDDHRHLQVAARRRAGSARRFTQPFSYFTVQAGPVRLVAIDCGVGGPLDRRQGEWLRRISAQPGPKILLLELPLYGDGQLWPRPIEGGGTIHEIAIDPDNEYLAVISGNTHNYQRYLVSLDGGRTMPFLVTGGGGAFLHETFTIPNLDTDAPRDVTEETFRCYPLRGDSLARCAQLWDRKLGGHGWLRLDPDVAAAIVGERLSLAPVRAPGREVRVSPRDRILAAIMYRAPGHPHTVFHSAFSSLLDWGEPPLFKHFLRIEADDGEVTIACHAVTGYAEDVERTIIEDRLTATYDGTRWNWDAA
jgi:hypothetical protein